MHSRMVLNFVLSVDVPRDFGDLDLRVAAVDVHVDAEAVATTVSPMRMDVMTVLSDLGVVRMSK